MLLRKAVAYGVKLVLTLILGLALVGSLSIPISAQQPVDLVLGGEGATNWSIGNIKPGDSSGTMTVELHNAGSWSCSVTIWVSDIVNSKGTNPESETGDTAEPGELGNYLIFNISGANLLINFTLPVEINDFPQSAVNTNHIYVNPLKAVAL